MWWQIGASLAGGLLVMWAAMVTALYFTGRRGSDHGNLVEALRFIPDFVPVVGYADDVIIVAIALRSVVRHAGAEALERHWSGASDGFRVVRRLTGSPVWRTRLDENRRNTSALEQAGDLVNVATLHIERLVMLPDRVLVGALEQAEELSVVVVIGLDLPDTELVARAVSGSLSDLLNGLRRQPQVVKVHALRRSCRPNRSEIMDIVTDMRALDLEARRHATVEPGTFDDVEGARAVQNDSHLLGIVVPIRGKSPYATGFQHVCDFVDEIRGHEATLAMPRLVPGVGEKQPQLIDRGGSQHRRQGFGRIDLHQPDVGQVGASNVHQRCRHSGTPDLQREKIGVRARGGSMRQRVPVTAADLDNETTAAPELGLGIELIGRVDRRAHRATWRLNHIPLGQVVPGALPAGIEASAATGKGHHVAESGRFGHHVQPTRH